MRVRARQEFGETLALEVLRRGGVDLKRWTRVDMMWGFNITGPMPFVTDICNNDQNNMDGNIGCFSEGIQQPHFGTGCVEPRWTCWRRNSRVF